MACRIKCSSSCIDSHVSLGIAYKHLDLCDVNLKDTHACESVVSDSKKLCHDSINILSTSEFHCLVTSLNSNDSSKL